MQKITEYVEKQVLPAIALRGIVVFPNVVTSFEIARKQSLRALKRAENGDGRIFLVAQQTHPFLTLRFQICKPLVL